MLEDQHTDSQLRQSGGSGTFARAAHEVSNAFELSHQQVANLVADTIRLNLQRRAAPAPSRSVAACIALSSAWISASSSLLARATMSQVYLSSTNQIMSTDDGHQNSTPGTQGRL